VLCRYDRMCPGERTGRRAFRKARAPELEGDAAAQQFIYIYGLHDALPRRYTSVYNVDCSRSMHRMSPAGQHLTRHLRALLI